MKAADCKMRQIVPSDFVDSVATYNFEYSSPSAEYCLAILFNAYKQQKGIFIQASTDSSPVKYNYTVLHPDVVPYFQEPSC